jgi:hypothetical protein
MSMMSMLGGLYEYDVHARGVFMSMMSMLGGRYEYDVHARGSL